MKPASQSILSRRQVVLLALAAAGACTPAPPPRHYVLVATAAGADAAPGQTLGRRSRTIGLQPVNLADYLDRQEIVVRQSDTAIRISEADRWAEQLDLQTARILAQNLEVLLPDTDVFLLPTSFVLDLERELVVEIDRFDTDSSGTVHLDARWQLNAPQAGRVVAERRAQLEENAGENPSYAAIAQAMSRALAGLARDIAAGIPDRR
jgi:uncharacterized lipoprotein YmbA